VKRRMTFFILGYVMLLEAVFMLPAMLLCIFDGDMKAAGAFAIVMAILLAISIPLVLKKPDTKSFHSKEGFIIAAVSWIVLGVFGGLPFYISGEIPSVVDCLFESISGFTTTGASILSNVEILPRGILLWRSFTHWIGGMGVLTFLLAVVTLAGGNSIYIMRAESPGPSPGKLVPKIRQTAKILYSIYIVMTVLEVIFLLAGGMPFFDSVVHAFGTAGTGGFSIKNASIAAYGSAYVDGVITAFMLLFGLNFNLYYFLLIKRFREFAKSEEGRTYFAIVICAIIAITINIFGTVYSTIPEAIRYSSFQVASIMTTTGFATANFDMWPQLSRMVLVFLMFIGACAGSTGGGIKVSRILILYKMARREIRRLIAPRSVEIVKIDGKQISSDITSATSMFFVIYMAILAASVLVISIWGYDLETTITAVIACLNNIGPGLSMVGPTGNYAFFDTVSKLVLAFNMLAGRLEIFPILILISPYGWQRRSKIKKLEKNIASAELNR